LHFFFHRSLYEALASISLEKDTSAFIPIFYRCPDGSVKSGAVTNRRKAFFPGKSTASYALGTSELMRWLNRNPLVEFQPIDVTLDPKNIG